jgi:phosphomannomutase
MTLIKSISGTRGTIGGRPGNNLTAQDLAEATAAYAQWVKNTTGSKTIVLGRDARISGPLVAQVVTGTLRLMGMDVVDLGLSTTPTVEMAVPREGAGGGIILTASHNPKQWNALKFLNAKGEFISAEDGAEILRLIASGEVEYATVDELGGYVAKEDYLDYHIEQILSLSMVNTEAVRAKQYRVVVDCVNSTGAISIVPLLKNLGCEVVALYDDLSGRFAHNPEPLPEHLSELSRAVVFHKAHLGVAVDPDVDRLALVCEDGEMFGEEYTLVAVADYVLRQRNGNTVSNLSSTVALRKVTESHGCSYSAAAVGEVNVVIEMKRTNAIIGGEGNGGIILPELHYGRDALVGLALFLSHLATSGTSASVLRRQYPNFFISKNKITLPDNLQPADIIALIKQKYVRQPQNTDDGLKLFFDGDDWIHLRQSNTEPIIRIYAESASAVTAENLAEKIKRDISEIIRGS